MWAFPSGLAFATNQPENSPKKKLSNPALFLWGSLDFVEHMVFFPTLERGLFATYPKRGGPVKMGSAKPKGLGGGLVVC